LRAFAEVPTLLRNVARPILGIDSKPRRHNHGIGRKRMASARLAKRSALLVDVFRQQPQPPFREMVKKTLPRARKLRL
jgi:hypothetical protein